MPYYVRNKIEGGIFFLTAVTHLRQPLFLDLVARQCLHDAIEHTRSCEPFELTEIVLLPDHIHLVIQMPAGDANFSSRISRIKTTFTRHWLANGGAESPQSESRARQEYRGIWQKRFWEHTVRDGKRLGTLRRVHLVQPC